MPTTPKISTKISTKVERITPQKAKDWLKEDQRIREKTGKRKEVTPGRFQRKIAKPTVKKLVYDIQNGHWMVNGQTIIFDSEGRLIDGQHRLTAIAESGVTVQSNVCRGVSAAAFESIDKLPGRRPHHLLQILGVDRHEQHAAVAIAFAEKLRTGTVMEKGEPINSMSKVVMERYLEHPEVTEYVDYVMELGARGLCSPGNLSAIYWVASDHHPEEATQFLHELIQGSGEPGSPALKVHNRLLEAKLGSPAKRLNPTEKAALIVKAWNATISGQPWPQRISWRGYYRDNPEPFPRIK